MPVVLSNVILAFAAKLPASLNNTCVVEPGAIVRPVAVTNARFEPVPVATSTWLFEPPEILTFPTAPKLATPLTLSAVNVPKLVMFGCAAVDKLPAIDVAEIFPAERFPVTSALPAMLAPVPVTVRTFAFPDTENLTLLLASTLTSEFPFSMNEPAPTEILVSKLPSP